MEPDFDTRVDTTGGAIVIYVTGTIDIANCESLRDAIEPHLGPNQTIVLDLSGVRLIASAGLAVLVRARGQLTADGGSLVLRNPSEVARRVLSAAGTEDLLAHDAGAGAGDRTDG
jgi:anti-sigma B factor antagonist